MFSKRYKVPDDLFRGLKALPDKSWTGMKTAMHTQLQPDVKKDVLDLLAPYPGPVVYPFQFATDKSRKAFFATNGFGKGIPTRRTDTLKLGWSVGIIERGDTIIVSIFNRTPYAKYVYGPRQVPGHFSTGWGKDSKEAIELIREDSTQRIIDLWRMAVKGGLDNVINGS